MADKHLSGLELDKLASDPLWKMDDSSITALTKLWYADTNIHLQKQRKIWDYSYLAYKGIMLWSEINRKKRSNGYNIYVNVPRTYATIEGIRKNFNINPLSINVDEARGIFTQDNKYAIENFLNYDIDRSKTKKQVKDAGFFKLLYGNGFLYSFLVDKKRKKLIVPNNAKPDKDGRITPEEGEEISQYYGMAAKAMSPYKVFPDRTGVTLDTTTLQGKACRYICLRDVKHINSFKNDWKDIIPEDLLDKVEPGGLDMTNYEAVRETIDSLFDLDAFRYPGTAQDYVKSSNVKATYDSNNMVEERIWLTEDSLVVQAGAGMKNLLIIPNLSGRYPLTKMDNVATPGEFWSMGEPYILRYQQVEENRLHNSILDLIHYSVSSMVGVNTGMLEDEYDLDIYPGKVWKMKLQPNVKVSDVLSTFQPRSDAIAPAMSFMNMVKGVGQQATSITDFVTGASESIASTATEANKLASASDLTIVDKIREMVEEAMIDMAEFWLKAYPSVYAGKNIKFANNGQKIIFFGKTKKEASEKEIAKAIGDVGESNLIFLDDLSVENPKLKLHGDIEISKDVKLRQWNAAIDFATKINKIAFETGERRRIDTIQMGEDAMSNFDVISDPRKYILDEQEVKMDQIDKQIQAGQQASQQGQGGGRPAPTNINPIPTGGQVLNSEAQPNVGL